MGNSISVPKDSSLGCILWHYDQFPLETLKRKMFILFYNTNQPQHKLEDGDVWAENGNFNYNTILQLDLFCKRPGKWTEIPYG